MVPIEFKKNEYDPFIDFIKGFCIISVVLTHSLPSIAKDYSLFYLWGGMAVPLFLMIQVFHTYKKGFDSKKKILSFKIVKRIVFPFLITQCAILSLKLIRHPEESSVFLQNILHGGQGPGSYYPWLYLEFAIVLWLLRPLFRNFSFKAIIVFTTVVSIALEFVSSYVDFSPAVYRLLFFRYFFLIALAIDWIYNGIVLDAKRLVLSVVSIGAACLFYIKTPNLEPFFFDNAWTVYHWICYFSSAYLLVHILKKVHILLLGKGPRASSFIEACGKSSYEIFLFQMFIFTSIRKEWFSFTSMPSANFICWFIFVNSVSIVPIVLFKKFYRKKDCQNGMR